MDHWPIFVSFVLASENCGLVKKVGHIACMEQEEPLGPSCPNKDSRESSIVTSQKEKKGIDSSLNGTVTHTGMHAETRRRAEIQFEQIVRRQVPHLTTTRVYFYICCI